MANSALRYRGNVPMEWMPEHLMDVKLKNSSMWSQHVKQLIMLTAGIETKSQEEMNKGQRQDFILSEYNNWCDILGQKHPNAPVLRWLKFTTGTRTTRIAGEYLFRNFQEGLRIFHNEFNRVWDTVLQEGTSGKSKEEIWIRFCYLLQCGRCGDKPEESTPEDFEWGKIERKKWVYAYKHTGPCCELLETGLFPPQSSPAHPSIHTHT